MTKQIIFLLLGILIYGGANAQKREIDIKLSVDTFYTGADIENGSTETIYFVLYNNGPDTVLANDYFWLSIRVFNIITNPIYLRFNEMLLPGDSLKYQRSFTVEVYSTVDTVDYCVKIKRVFSLTGDSIALETKEQLIDNEVCTRAKLLLPNSIDEKSWTQHVGYPNPFASSLQFSSGDKPIIDRVMIYYTLGAVILDQSNIPPGTIFDTRNWPPGIYFAHLFLGEETTSLRLIKSANQ